MAQDSGADGFIQGANAKAELMNKAVNLEKQSFELEEQKQAVELNKFNMFRNGLNGILIQKPGKIRDLAIAQFEEQMRITGRPMHPGWKDILNDTDSQDVLQKFTNHVLKITDKDASAAMQGIVGYLSDPVKGFMAIGELAAKIDQQDRETMLKAQAHGKTSPADKLKLTNETISNIRQSYTTQIETINAAENISSLGVSAESRNNNYARDAVKSLYSRLIDPRTGVKEQEVARISGLGAGAYERAKQTMKKFSEGEGPLNDAQWKEVLRVSDALGTKVTEVINESRKTRSPEFIEAGLNPEQIYSQIPQYKPFDFAKAFPNDKRFRSLSAKNTGSAKAKIKQQQDEAALARTKKNIEIVRAANPGISDEEIAKKVKDMIAQEQAKLKER